MTNVRPAATVMVFRHGEEQPLPELLLLQRSRRSGFFPSAWVFPGGRVDAADSEVAWSGESGSREHRAFVVAAIRECFEEAGVWLGEGEPTVELRNQLNKRQATLLDHPGLTADLGRMAEWSWWITPEAEPKRYDTRFFLTCLRPDERSDAEQDHVETVACRWITAAQAVAEHEAGQLFMAPPTYITLRELRHFSSLEAIWGATKGRDIKPIMPVHRKDRGAFEILLPGHPDHPVREQILESMRVILHEERWLLD